MSGNQGNQVSGDDGNDETIAYLPGNEILACRPLAYAVLTKYSKFVCDHCLKVWQDRLLQKCSSCEAVRYCGSTCQRAGWAEVHQMECRMLTAVKPKVPNDTVRLLLRLNLRLRRLWNSEEERDRLPDGSTRSFSDLWSHSDLVKQDTVRMEAFQAFLVVYRQCESAGSFDEPPLDEAALFDVFCRMVINSYNIMDDEYRSIGIGLYLGASVFDHSCMPNANVIFRNGKELVVRCTQPIVGRRRDFRQLVRVSYISAFLPYEDRAASLERAYYFRCTCPACSFARADFCSEIRIREEAKRGAMICSFASKSSCGGHVPTCRASCPKCGAKVLGHVTAVHSELTEKCRAMLLQEEQDVGKEQEWRQLYKAMAHVFHPCDHNFFRVLDKMFDLELKAENWRSTLAVGKKMLEAYENLCPEYDINIGLMSMKVGKLASFMQLDDLARKLFTLARSVLSVTHGRDHQIVSVTLRELAAQVDS